MPSKTALFVCGGWQNHQPKETAAFFAAALQEKGFTTALSDTLDVLLQSDTLCQFSLIVPVWTMGTLPEAHGRALAAAVAAGTGLAGWHGGMGDAFRENTDYQFIVGGQFVAHPGNFVDYTVNITRTDHPITAGLSDFNMHAEQYYMHVDPSNTVLATTTFDGATLPHIAGTVIPVVWTRRWGAGRVAYCSLGHDLNDFAVPQAAELVRRALLWAAE